MFYQVFLLPNIHLRDGFISCTLSFKQNSIHVIPKIASALLKNSVPLNKLWFPPLPSYHPLRAARTRMNAAFIPIATGSSRLLIKLGETAGVGGMHLHTYTDKVDAAKPVRQTVVVNPQVDLRQSWMATRWGNRCIFHGGHVGAWHGQTGRENWCAQSMDFRVRRPKWSTPRKKKRAFQK